MNGTAQINLNKKNNMNNYCKWPITITVGETLDQINNILCIMRIHIIYYK